MLLRLAPLLFALALLSPLAQAAGDPQPQQDWMVHMNRDEQGWSYVPGRIVLVPGGVVQLMVFGKGQFSLTLTDVEGYDADIATDEGVVRTAEFRAPATPGEYSFHDKYHPEATGVLVVKPRVDAARLGVVPGGYESRFAPARLEVAPGQDVVFAANGSFQHNLESVDGRFSAGDVRAGNESRFQAPLEPGEYPFVCRFHEAQGMRGVLVVRADATPPGENALEASRQETPAPTLPLALLAVALALRARRRANG